MRVSWGRNALDPECSRLYFLSTWTCSYLQSRSAVTKSGDVPLAQCYLLSTPQSYSDVANSSTNTLSAIFYAGPGSHIAFSHHVSLLLLLLLLLFLLLSFFHLEQFLSLFLFSLTLTVLRNTGQLFCLSIWVHLMLPHV